MSDALANNTDPKNSTAKSNVPEFSVQELAFSLKRTLEENFGRVRVRGELSRVSIAASGHMYSSLKDDQAVIDAVCWKGTMAKLSVKPEEGLEVICTGTNLDIPATFELSADYRIYGASRRRRLAQNVGGAQKEASRRRFIRR